MSQHNLTQERLEEIKEVANSEWSYVAHDVVLLCGGEADPEAVRDFVGDALASRSDMDDWKALPWEERNKLLRQWFNLPVCY